MDNKNLYYIWLSSTLVAGSKTPKILLEHFGDIEKIYNAQKQDYTSIGIHPSDVMSLCNKNLDNAKRYLEYCEKSGVGILTYDNPSYPERLKIIDNPPPMFYYKGRLKMLDDYPCITMVGTRSCSERGFRFAYETAYDAASKGAVIVNGLALGIDGACIAACLDANGYAVGLLGCGIDTIYPYGNKDLFDRLSNSGLILSEFSPFSEPEGKNFPVRNRVMSALSLATCVFEAADGSGAKHTARHALEQGRRIFAVPAKPYDKSYAVALELIKEGATVFTESDDILIEYSMNFPHRINLANTNEVPKEKLDNLVAKYFKKDTDPDAPVNRRFGSKAQNKPTQKKAEDTPAQIKPTAESFIKQKEEVREQQESTEKKAHDLSTLSTIERKIYDTLCEGTALSPDEIASRGIRIEEILATLTLLEIYGLITAMPGGKYIAV